MRAVCADFETELIEFNGENNHVHLLVNLKAGALAHIPVAASRSGRTTRATSSRDTITQD